MKLWAVKIRIWALKWAFVPTIEGLETEGVAWILKMMGKILKNAPLEALDIKNADLDS